VSIPACARISLARGLRFVLIIWVPMHSNAGRILNSFRRMVRFLRVSSRAAEKNLGLSGAQLFVLHTLGAEPGLSINELAERTHTHQSSVSTVVTRLEKQGLVSRVPAPEDRRQARIALTSEGKSRLRRAPETAQERLLGGIARLSTDDQAELARLLESVLQNSGLATEPADLFFEDPQP
jgi:DNA-binding MarR family transcriptional regulator